ncbi:MAG: hypothetical protein ACI4JN_11450, partial [Ruminococcus sp.]
RRVRDEKSRANAAHSQTKTHELKNKEQKQKFRIVKGPDHKFKDKTESLVYGTVKATNAEFF